MRDTPRIVMTVIIIYAFSQFAFLGKGQGLYIDVGNLSF